MFSFVNNTEKSQYSVFLRCIGKRSEMVVFLHYFLIKKGCGIKKWSEMASHTRFLACVLSLLRFSDADHVSVITSGMWCRWRCGKEAFMRWRLTLRTQKHLASRISNLWMRRPVPPRHLRCWFPSTSHICCLDEVTPALQKIQLNQSVCGHSLK